MKIGIIGLGKMGQNHLNELGKNFIEILNKLIKHSSTESVAKVWIIKGESNVNKN